MNCTGCPRRASPTATLSGLPPTWASIPELRWTTSTRPSPITVSMVILCQRTPPGARVPPGSGLLPRQCELEDLRPGGSHLLQQRPGGVRQAVAPANFLHLRRHFAVPVGRKVREQVVLDLVGQVAGHDVHELGTGDVGRADHLADVPVTAS